MELEIKKKKRTITMMSLGNNNATTSSSSNSSDQNPSDEPITTSTCPTWKLYENPFYNSHQNHHHHHPHRHRHQNHHQDQTVQSQSQSQSQGLAKNLQFLHLPLSARKLAASFWDLTFFKPAAMEAEALDRVHQLAELRAELECERKARKKLDGANKRLAKELAEERRARESMQRMCEELAREISSDKAEMARMRREIDEERKMLRMSEVLREERVQMKLADAKIALEEKLSELDQLQLGSKRSTPPKASASTSNLSWKFRQYVLGEKLSASSSSSTLSQPVCDTIRADSMESVRSVFSGHHEYHDHVHSKSLSMSDHDHRQYQGCDSVANNSSVNVNVSGGNTASLPIFQRKSASPETENPHIKRGIKGFVEFPRVVKSIGTRHRQWGTKLECQKAQLRILLKQKSPIRSSNNLIIS